MGSWAEALELRGRRCEAVRLSVGRVYFFRTSAGNYAILLGRQFSSFAFVALLARVKPGKFNCKSHDTVDASNQGASPFVISYRAFPGPHSESVGRNAPSLSPGGPKQRAEGDSSWMIASQT